jgi:hypothetical protein
MTVDTTLEVNRCGNELVHGVLAIEWSELVLSPALYI